MKWQIAIKYRNGRVIVKEYASMRTAFVASDKYMRLNDVLSVTPSPA